MKAALIVERGGPEGRVVAEHPEPTPGPGEAVVRVRAVGLNHLDIFVRRGVAGKHLPLPHVSGGDIAGEVHALGAGVTGVQIGQRVLIDPLVDNKALGEDLPGGLAEYAVAPAKNLIPLADGVSFEQAASLPIAYGTALRMLITRGRLQAGETVAILGASGGVGVACVQIAKLTGAKVIACAGTQEKLDRLGDLGADVLVNYREEDFSKRIWAETGKTGVDMMVDYTGADTWEGSVRATKVGGRIVTCGATSGYDVSMFLPYVWVREIDILGSNAWTRDDLQQLLDWIGEGRLEPVVHGVFPLEEIHEAERLLEDREVFGKVLVRP